jgi:hypothetical protein
MKNKKKRCIVVKERNGVHFSVNKLGIKGTYGFKYFQLSEQRNNISI